MIRAEDIHAINTLAKRMVENQQKSASLELVGFDADKHDILESMLESTKPPIDEALARRHYLIKTPFRYPPLAYGSRFGQKHERGIFYASLSEHCLLCEVAYYRFVFIDDMATPFAEAIVTEHTLFNVRIESQSALFLDQGRFDAERETWTDPQRYEACQKMGTEARKRQIDVIQYYSARSPKRGRNLAVLNHEAIQGTPRNLQSVRCSVFGDQVHFLNLNTHKSTSLNRELFSLDGKLPRPSE